MARKRGCGEHQPAVPQGKRRRIELSQDELIEYRRLDAARARARRLERRNNMDDQELREHLDILASQRRANRQSAANSQLTEVERQEIIISRNTVYHHTHLTPFERENNEVLSQFHGQQATNAHADIGNANINNNNSNNNNNDPPTAQVSSSNLANENGDIEEELNIATQEMITELPYIWQLRFRIIDFVDETIYPLYDCGKLDQVCKYCGARFWAKEKNTHNEYNTCCSQGSIKLPPLREPPPLTKELLLGQSDKAKLFLRKPILINSSISFASIAYKKEETVSRGVPSLRICGNILHFIGSATTSSDKPKFLQCFFYSKDGDTAIMNTLEPAEEQLCKQLIQEAKQYNSFFHTLRENLQTYENDSVPNARMVISDAAPPEAGTRTYNKPVVVEVAAIVQGDVSKETREIVIHAKDSDPNNPKVSNIKSTHSAYDSLSYLIFHMYGDKGWTFRSIPKYKKQTSESFVEIPNKFITAQDFYAYRLQIRDQSNPGELKYDALLHGGLLTLQYFCDVWVKVEETRLSFISQNQKLLKTSLYRGLQDAVYADDARSAGTFKILPSSHQNSPRQQYQSYQDAMARVRAFGKPDLFITMTCNPNWIEIQRELRPNELAWMRPDICNRVFKMKLDALMDDIIKGSLFGRVLSYTSVIEFQKRGLPHCHILIILHADDKPETQDDFDLIVCAEIPDPIRCPRLYKCVTTHMIHGPCGDYNTTCVCMSSESGTPRCTKRFPKKLQSETLFSETSYPTYRRRGKHKFEPKNSQGEVLYSLDDSWVVPYNSQLLLKYDCHINIEICTTMTVVQYLYKYVYKGGAKASVSLHQQMHQQHNQQNNNNNNEMPNIDEIQKYVDSRYISAYEACWRLYSYPMSNSKPSITRLQIHEEGQHTITYEAGQEEQALEDNADGKTTLTEYFKTCAEEAINPIPLAELRGPPSSELTYQDFPKYYTWSKKKWTRRKKSLSIETIGRIYSIHPSAGERFYLRILLTVIKGAKSFEHIRTVNDVVCQTYKEACTKLGLLADDSEWSACLLDASDTCSPKQLRQLFVHIVSCNSPADPQALWRLMTKHMSEDFEYKKRLHEQNQFVDLDSSERVIIQSPTYATDMCLYELDDMFLKLSNASRGLSFYSLPSPVTPRVNLRLPTTDNVLLLQELQYTDDTMQLEKYYSNYASANVEQRQAIDTLNAAISAGASRIFFLDAPGGTGKSFVSNTILAYWRYHGHVCVATASSGIAAIAISGATTSHSRYGIPLALHVPKRNTVITKTSNLGKMLMKASFILWDEAPMSSANQILYVDTLFRQLMGSDTGDSDIPFGGKIVLFCGDFRQNLPVIKKMHRAGIVANTMLALEWWDKVECLHLTINERVRRNGDTPQSREFMQFLLSIGEGTVPNIPNTDLIRIPEEYIWPNSDMHAFVNWCYPDISSGASLGDKAILAPTNKNVDELNKLALDSMNGTSTTLLSSDSVIADNDSETEHFPVEYLNSINLPGMPPHSLELKKGAPVILLRNMDTSKGLCNGTRLVVDEIHRKFLTLRVTNGSHVNSICMLPRIDLRSAEDTLPFILNRRQFPIKLAFAMTINKSQGQSLLRVGVYLPTPVFSHGQLYVALSRSGVRENTKLFIADIPEKQGRFPANSEKGILAGTYTRNPVYHEVLSRNI